MPLATLLAVAGALEGATGLVLILAPQLFTRLLLGAGVEGPGAALGRMAGLALIGMAVACWPGRGANAPALRGLLTYNVMASVYLLLLCLQGQMVGPLLWPATAAHLVMTVLLGQAGTPGRRED